MPPNYEVITDQSAVQCVGSEAPYLSRGYSKVYLEYIHNIRYVQGLPMIG